MSCAEFTPKLELMADDELSTEQAAAVLSHIDDCSPCRDKWYEILGLRQSIKDRAASFVPSADFEDKIINSIRKEAWQSKAGQSKKSRLAIAAAILALGAVATFFFMSGQGNPTISTVPPHNTSGVTQPPDTTGSAPVVAQTQGTTLPASLDDALGNFKQYLKSDKAPENNGGSGSGNSGGNGSSNGGSNRAAAADLAQISARVGFNVKPMAMSGFKFAGASVVSAAPGKAEMVRLCYVRKNGEGKDAVVCYQAAPGRLVAKGLDEHNVDGRKVCCGESGENSIVYIPGQSGQPNETLLLGTISKRDLMDLALSSS